MKHFTIRLSDHKAQTRQWGVWSDNLTIGSDPRCDLVLPAPAPALAAVFRESSTLDTPFGHLVVVEDTPQRLDLWARATARISRSRMLGWREPGQGRGSLRAGVFAAFGIFAVFGMTGLAWYGMTAPRIPDPPDYDVITLVMPDETPKVEEKVPEPKPEVDQQDRGSDVPKVAPEGGSTETRTQVWPPSAPSSVMANSVIDKLNTATDGLEGEDVDPNEKNVIDVILAGGGGHLQKGSRGGQGASGDGDRMAGIGGNGLGNGGRAGFGTGVGGRPGKMVAGAGQSGTGTAMRSIREPKPSDVELGGDAGTRSPESILRVIRQHIGGFRYSYEKYLRDNPNLGGKISVRFTIAPSGDIISISIVNSNTGNEELDGDIKLKAGRMKFDQIEKGNVTVTYAFVLDRQ
ncbi:MAG: AgmX/PglI C-terminal domain-containing protein [Fibrobacteres bacterium]|nr:AgmX/PglI C-terminal domain-containing protein [Fibrobacterota bacterium]